MAGIYFHIPFCKQACHYCNFYFTTSLKNVDSSTEAMIKELEFRKEYLEEQEISSIYFGGGTPSMLDPKEIQRLIEAVKLNFQLEDEIEITLEANPDNLNAEYLKSLLETDVNRFSIGIQSFFEDDLVWMNRAHNVDEAENCVSLCRSFGYTNFSIDLIFGIPISNANHWKKNLEKVVSLKPHHISCYALTVEEGTALNHHIKVGKSPNVIDKDQEEQFYMAHDFLEKQGYEHYEISNYSLSGHESKHNSSYWEGQHYLGIGPGAHSFNGQSRSWNIAHLPKYLKGIESWSPDISTEILSSDDQYNEWVMTGLRKKTGLLLSDLAGKFASYKSYFHHAIADVPKSYYIMDADSIYLSRKGLIFADFVGSTLFKI